MKFLPKKGHEVSIGDVIRFGRIPFKVSKLVLDVQGEKRKERAEKESIQKAASAASQSMSRIDIVDEENPSQPDVHDQTSANLIQDPLADASHATIPVATRG